MSERTEVPAIRIRELNGGRPDPGASYVLYWMTAFRRTRHNFALQRAAQWASKLGRPLAVLEALRCDYPWASDRLHRFVLDGMAANAGALAGTGAGYLAFVESRQGEGKGLLEALASRACVVVTDDYPCFFLPRMQEAAAPRMGVLMEAVDSNGLLPIRAAEAPFRTAHGFRRHLQRVLLPHLLAGPMTRPLGSVSLKPFPGWPPGVLDRWPAARMDALRSAGGLAALPIDHDVGEAGLCGGEENGLRHLNSFVSGGLPTYADRRSGCDKDSGSGLSPYLHFGHISAHEVFAAVADAEDWNPARLAPKATGGKAGWWGMPAGAEAFLDQLVTWRELGFNVCAHLPQYDRYESLPPWSRRTLELHASDRRRYLYSQDQLEGAATHDPLWNAAQRQLMTEGRIQNYLRMLWGKKILEWSPTPERALEVMIHLNNKYALDGRDPNSYTGIFWVLGRHDRPWGPQRPVFGSVRYMSSENTAKKMDVRGYLLRHGP